MTSPSKRLRVTVSAELLPTLRLLAVESGNVIEREASLLLALGIRTAAKRYRAMYGVAPEAESNIAMLAQIDRMLGYNSKPAEGEQDIAQPPGPQLSATNLSPSEAADWLIRNYDPDARTRPPWGPEEVEDRG